MVTPLMPDGAPPPLEGVRAIEIASGLAVAYCGRLLAQTGVEVIRIEPPGGDAIRRAGPFKDDRTDLDGGGRHRLLNAGKRSIELDLATPEGVEALEPLLRGSALLIGSWRTPSALPLAEPEQMRERFPETTYVSISEFGIDGPYASHQADSHIIEALAGNSYVSGDPDREPLSSGVELADYFGAVVGWIGALAAVAEARAGERPGFVDVSIHETLTMTDDHNLSVYLGTGGVRRRFYSQILPGYPSDIFACKDGYIAFVTAGPGGRDFAGNISKLIEQPELATHPLFADAAARVVNWREFDELVQPWFDAHTSREIFLRTGELDLGFGEVAMVPDLLDDPHLEDRGYWRAEVDANGEATGGVLPGPAGRFTESPLLIGPEAPALGEANALLSEAGATDEPAPARSAARREAPSGRLRYFEGIRVVDLSRGWTGSLAGRLLSELGADVVKVEYARPPHSSIGPAYFTARQASKRSAALNLRAPEGRELMLRLLERADVFVENFPPRVTRGLHLTYPEIVDRCPRIVMCSIAGFGQSGPNGERSAVGMTMEAASGPAAVTGYPGEPPLKTGQTWVDPFTGLNGVGAIIAALMRREVTGRGQRIDVSMQESTVPTLAPYLGDYLLNGRLHGGDGNRRPGMVRGAYPCAGDDDWVAISMRNYAEWEAFCRATGHDAWLSDYRFASAGARTRHHDVIDALIADWTRERTKSEVAELLQAAGVPAAGVLKADEILLDPHLRAREFFDPVHVADLGPVPLQRYFPPKFDGRGFPTRNPVPPFGEHTAEALMEVGLTEAEAREAAGSQGLVAPSVGWWDPDVVAARDAEFADYADLGSILRFDADFLERVRIP